MKSSPALSWIGGGRSTRLLRWVLGGLFLLAGYGKIAEPNAFFASLMNFGYFEANFAFAISRSLPWMEVAAGLWLISGWRPLLAAAVGGGLTLVFTAVLFLAWWQGLEVDCSCFGPLSLGNTPGAGVLRNLLLLTAFAWLGWRCYRQSQKVTLS